MSKVQLRQLQPCPHCVLKDRKIAELKRALERHEALQRRTLKDEGLLRKNPHDTEVQASYMQIGKVGTKRRTCYEFIVQQGKHGATDDEIMEAAIFGDTQHTNHSNTTARRGELVKGGFVVDSGKRRKTRTGADAIVWVAKEYR